jgi:hypothetical protein
MLIDAIAAIVDIGRPGPYIQTMDREQKPMPVGRSRKPEPRPDPPYLQDLLRHYAGSGLTRDQAMEMIEAAGG